MDSSKLKILMLVLVLSVTFTAQAQTTLAMLTPTTATLPPGGTNSWTFNAQNSAVLSFALETTDSDFDPMMTLTDSSGNLVMSSDDYNYPASLNPLLEAVTIPRTDTYTLTISGVNGTSGEYTLAMLPGYSVAAYADDFSQTDWRPVSDILTAQRLNDQLTLNISGARQFSTAFSSTTGDYADFYAQTRVVNISNSSGWIVGIALRREGDSYYLLSVNSLGTSRFTLMEDGAERVIRDWTPHPNIVPGATSFTLGVLAKGSGFDFFYNTGFIGSASDTTLTGAGEIGLMLGTFSSQSSISSATFDDLVVTTPAQVNNADVIPQQVLPGDGTAMVQMLKRTHVISAAGEMGLTIPESSVQFSGAGINRVMFGRGTQFTNFALGATVNLSAAARGPAGCGIIFRLTGETDYTLAYFNQDGEYGLSQRTGDTFSSGIYGQNAGFSGTQHHMLLIASGDTVYFYLDRVLVGTFEASEQTGEVGITVVNFESNSTTCSYGNLWLWRWE